MTAIIQWIEAHPGTASWIQAIGALLAIVAAFLVTSMQARATRRQRKREDVERLEAITEILNIAVSRAIETRRAFDKAEIRNGTPVARPMDTRDMEAIMHSFKEIRIDQLPSGPAVNAIAAAQAAIRGAFSHIPRAFTEIHERHLAGIDDFVGELRAAHACLVVKIRRLRRQDW